MLMEHNIPVYEKFEAMLEEHGKVILITATGTGKSYVTLEYLERHDLRALVVCPKVSICNNWKKLTDKADTITYQKLSRTNSSHEDKLVSYVNNYDLIVFDEAHHIGGKIWSKAFNKLSSIIESSDFNCKIIGLTADSKRYFENGRDVAEEYFDDNIVYGYSQAEAVEIGVLPKAEYVVSLFNIEDAYKKYIHKRSSLTTKLIGQLDYVFKNTGSIKDIVYKHVPNGNRKGIIFVDRIKSIANAINLFKDIFPNETFFFIHSGMDKEKNNKILEEFTKADRGFIVTIDMLNEGLHVYGINTIIMLRRTESPMVFIQQLGRGLASNGKDIIIFDFVGNAANIKISYNNIEEIENISESHRKYMRKLSNQFIVHDYMTPILNILHIIEEGICKKYTKYDDDFLKENYKKYGAAYCAEMLNRTVGSVQSRAGYIGLTIFSRWTIEDDNFLIENHKKMTSDEIAIHLGKTKSAVENRKYILKLTYLKVIDYDKLDEAIRSKSDDEKWNDIAKRFGVSSNSVSKRAKYLGLVEKTRHKYTEEEDKFIRDNYQEKGSEYCAKQLGLSKNAIVLRANKLGLQRVYKWPKEDIDKLKDLAKEGYSYKEIGLILNRSKSSVTGMAQKLSIGKRKKYTKEDDEFIIKNYKKLGAQKCAEYLGRTAQSIKTRANSLKITDTNYRSKLWTDEMDKILIDNYPIIGSKAFDLIPDMNRNDCNYRVRLLNLTSPKTNIPYSNKERDFILKYYPIIGSFVKEYGNRNTSSIHNFANRNNIKFSGNKYHWNCSDLVEIDYYLTSNNSIDKNYLASKYNKPIEAIDQIIDIFNSYK